MAEYAGLPCVYDKGETPWLPQISNSQTMPKRSASGNVANHCTFARFHMWIFPVILCVETTTGLTKLT